MKTIRKNRGFSLAEMLVVVAIMGILSGFGAVEISSYVRKMTKVQYDGYAREIFVAAQNHLTMAASQGYLGREDYGEQDEYITGAFYFDPRNSDNDNSVLKLILPDYAVDENIKTDAEYLIRYHKDSAQIIDVFYWTKLDETGKHHTRFYHSYVRGVDYSGFHDAVYDDDKVRIDMGKESLLEYGSSVIGYYGGTEAGSMDRLTRGAEIIPPRVIINNKDRLDVSVVNSNSNAKLKLIIRGETSKAEKIWTETDAEFQILDDITSGNPNGGLHFATRYGLLGFTPGENLEIYAVAYSDLELTNVASSPVQITNSLFGDSTDIAEKTAEIEYFRHLENLSYAISGVNNPLIEPAKAVSITSAKQTRDLYWDKFYKDFYAGDVSVSPISGSPTAPGYYMPVTPKDSTKFYSLVYDGGGCTISNVKINSGDDSKNAGLFGTLKKVSEDEEVEDSGVHDLKLEDFSVIGVSGGSTGALAGSASGAEFENVLACNKEHDSAAVPTISGPGSTGGLVGSAEKSDSTNCTFKKCAAALVVSGGGNAGGLIGTASGTKIEGCYSGGHTVDGKYTSNNVTGTGNVGGLVGSYDGGTIKQSYSTCSVGGGNNVGGLVGSAGSTAEIKNSYAAGKVQGTNAGAFAGRFSASVSNLTDCHYYEIINELPLNEAGNVDLTADGGYGYTYLNAMGDRENNTISGRVDAFDASAAAYNGFIIGDRDPAIPYDGTLRTLYRGKYSFNTIAQLVPTQPDYVKTSDFVSWHYGDWSTAETSDTLVKNEKITPGG